MRLGFYAEKDFCEKDDDSVCGHAAVFWTGCSFGGNGGESKTYDPDLKIEKLEASQQTIVYKDQDGQLNEVARL